MLKSNIYYLSQLDGKMDATEEIDDKRALDFFSRAMSESRRYVFTHKFAFLSISLIREKNVKFDF